MQRNLTSGRAWSVIGLCAAAGLAVAHPGHDYGGGDPGSTHSGGFEALNVEVTSHVRLQDFPGFQGIGNDCWGYVSPSGREYALMGLQTGIAFVEITDPTEPVILAMGNGNPSTWHDVKTYGHHAYAVSEAGPGIRVYDLSDIDNGNVTHVRTVSTGGISATHNVAIDEVSGFLYRTGGGDRGLRIYDLNPDPSNPQFVTDYSPFYSHDAQIVTYTEGPYAGRQIAYCFSGTGTGGFGDPAVRIVDVTDKSDIQLLSTVRYSNRSFCHQGWLSEDRQYLYVNDETDEYNGILPTTTTRVVDVSDIENPVEVSTFTTGLGAIDHNLYTHDGKIFQANYRSGMRVFDAADPLAPEEVAWLDTFPANDEAEFDGAWSLYPYFPSGTIIISDIQQGLVVTRLTLERIEFDFHHGLPTVADPLGGTGIHAHIHPYGGIEVDLSTVRLHADAGAGPIEIEPTTITEDGHTQFYLPAFDCGSTIEWWVSAQSVDGDAWTYPRNAEEEPATLFVASRQERLFADGFEADQGWTVAGDAIAGGWDRAAPDGARGAPPADYDDNGFSYVTGGSRDEDLDLGTTALTSPPIDLSESGTITYAYWFNDLPDGPASADDGLFVEYAVGDSAWTRVRTHDQAAAGWRTDALAVPGDVPAEANVRLRFIAADIGQQNVIEAAVDAVHFDATLCASCRGDHNADGATNVADLLVFLQEFRMGHAPDLDRNGGHDIGDLLAYLSAFREGC